MNSWILDKGNFCTLESWYTFDTKSSELLDTILLNTEYFIIESWTWISWYYYYWYMYVEQSTHGAKYTSHTRCGWVPLESVRVPLESTGSGEWSKVHMERSTHHNVVGDRSSPWGCLLSPETVSYMVNKRCMEQSTHHVTWWGYRSSPWGCLLSPLNRGHDPHILMFTCCHVLLISVLNWTQRTISTIPTNNNVRSICYSVTPLFAWR